MNNEELKYFPAATLETALDEQVKQYTLNPEAENRLKRNKLHF